MDEMTEGATAASYRTLLLDDYDALMDGLHGIGWPS